MSNNLEQQPVSTIEGLRAHDETGKNGETIPEKQTLNSSRVADFLRRNGVGINNIDNIFNFEVSSKLVGEGYTEMEKTIHGILNGAKAILSKYKCPDLALENSEAVVDSKLEALKTGLEKMSPAEAAKIKQAWNYHNLIREYARRMLNIESNMKATRMDTMTESKGLDGSIKDSLHEARVNWDKLSSGQKIAFAGMAILGAAVFLKSDNSSVKWIRDKLWTGVQIMGGAWVLNKAWYLFTGETAWDAVTGGSKKMANSEFLKNTFKTDEKGSDLLTQAMVKLGDTPFMEISQKYAAAKASGANQIEIKGMNAGDAYKAMDVFFSKYSLDNLNKAYSQSKPPMSFSQVMIAEMAKDPDVKMQQGVASRVADSASEYFKRGFNYVSSSAPAVWMTEKYRKWFGKDPNKQQLNEMLEKFKATVQDEKDFHSAIEKQAYPGSTAAKHFIDTDLTGKIDGVSGVKYKDGGDGYIYLISSQNVGNMQNNPSAGIDAVKSGIDKVEEFTKTNYKGGATVGDAASIFIANKGEVRVLVRYKK